MPRLMPYIGCLVKVPWWVNIWKDLEQVREGIFKVQGEEHFKQESMCKRPEVGVCIQSSRNGRRWMRSADRESKGSGEVVRRMEKRQIMIFFSESWVWCKAVEEFWAGEKHSLAYILNVPQEAGQLCICRNRKESRTYGYKWRWDDRSLRNIPSDCFSFLSELRSYQSRAGMEEESLEVSKDKGGQNSFLVEWESELGKWELPCSTKSWSWAHHLLSWVSKENS